MSDRDFPAQDPEIATGPARGDHGGGGEREEAATAPETSPGKTDSLPQGRACREFMEQLPFGVLTARSDFSVDYLNGRFREMFGYEPGEIPDIRAWFEKFAHRSVPNGMPDPFFQGGSPAEGGVHREACIAVQTKRGGWRLCQVHFIALADGRLLTTYENMAGRSSSDSELQYTKIDSVDILSGGLALILKGITDGLQGLQEIFLGENSPAGKQLLALEQEARSAEELLRKIRGFAGSRVSDTAPIDLNEIIRKTSTIFANTRGGMSVRRKLDEALWAVEVDRIQIEKMLIHLYFHLNQVDPAGSGLLIETGNVHLSAPESTLYRIKPGRYAKVSLASNAVEQALPGRPRALRLSTLMNDAGLRDNLSLTYAQCIIQGHGGVMTLGGADEAPSAVQFLLPAAGAASPESSVPRRAAASPGTVLLVDDDEVLSGLIREILEASGYQVLTAFNGREAVAVYDTWRDGIDLVLLDMIMPGMGGAETFRELKAMNPDVSVLVISAYSLPDEVRDLLAQGCKGFLQKPFRIPELLSAIRRSVRPGGGRKRG